MSFYFTKQHSFQDKNPYSIHKFEPLNKIKYSDESKLGLFTFSKMHFLYSFLIASLMAVAIAAPVTMAEAEPETAVVNTRFLTYED
jgi:hypothetical protein